MHQNEPAADRPGPLLFLADVTTDWRSETHYEVNSVLISIKMYSNDAKPLCFTAQESNDRKPTAKSSEDQLKEGEKEIANGRQPSDLDSKEHRASSDCKP